MRSRLPFRKLSQWKKHSAERVSSCATLLETSFKREALYLNLNVQTTFLNKKLRFSKYLLQFLRRAERETSRFTLDAMMTTIKYRAFHVLLSRNIASSQNSDKSPHPVNTLCGRRRHQKMVSPKEFRVLLGLHFYKLFIVAAVSLRRRML